MKFRRELSPSAPILLLAGALTLGLGSVAVQGHDSATDRTAEQGAAAGSIRRGWIQVDSLERSFLLYTPAARAVRPGLVLAFHGSGGEGARLRGFVGESLERLADQYGLLVVYPDGFGGNWNDCRGRAPFAANRLQVDDVAFVRSLIDRFRREHGVDPAAVYALGYSNGGHLAYRLALEVPYEIQTVAAIGANLPVREELDCSPSGLPVSVLIVNGTADRINPYVGGEVILPGGESFGRVRSAEESATYFAQLAGYEGLPVREEIASDSGGLRVQRTAWERAGTPGVVLYTVHGGGHTIPGPRAEFPPLLGVHEHRLDAVAEAVRFFRAQSAAAAESRRVRFRTVPVL